MSPTGVPPFTKSSRDKQRPARPYAQEQAELLELCTRWRPVRAEMEGPLLSTESIVSQSPPAPGAAPQCASCDAPLAADQRYCLQCGERCIPVSSFLFGDQPAAADAQRSPGATPPVAPAGASGSRSNSTLLVIAGVGVLLLAMGVGVLIGRSSAPKQVAGPAQVISVNPAPSAAGAGGTTEATFSDDWPVGTSGYTVQLQTLPLAGTTVSAVDAAKTAAGGKGAKAVGALKTEDFSSLTAGSYLIYSGEYHTRAQAEKALVVVKKSFPGATVVKVSTGPPAGSGSGSGSGGASTPGAGSPNTPSSLSHPAPPSALKGLSESKGKSYEEKSKNLPDNVET